jgi:tetratricopeptide (TPR) repeat protein
MCCKISDNHRSFEYSGKILLISLLILIFIMSGGCGRGKAIKGIDERELTPPDFTRRIPINIHGYNHFVNASILEAMGELPLANKQYKKALDYYPESDEIRYAYASTLMKLQNFRAALNETEKIFPRDSRTWLLLANNYYALNILDSSIIAFLKCIESDTDNVQVYYRLASYYNDINNLDSAIWAYKNIARITSAPKSFREVGNLQTRAGYLDDAVGSYKKSLYLDSTENNVKAFVALALIYDEKGDSAKAIQYFEGAAERIPNDAFVQDKLLRYYEKNGNVQKIIETAKTIISLVPQDNDMKRRLAMVYFEIDSLHLADSIFALLREKNEDNIIDLYYSGRIAIINEELNKAKSLFSRLTVVADSVVDGWLNLGWVYRLQDSADLEIAAYQSGLPYVKNLNDSTRLLYALAVSHERHGMFDLSIRLFESLIKLQPSHGPALNYLGYMLAEREVNLQYARRLIEKALETMPENGAYIDSYGWVLFKLGETEKALKELLRAYKYIDNDPVVADHIGDVYKALGEMENARLYWNKALELDTNNESIKEKLEK